MGKRSEIKKFRITAQARKKLPRTKMSRLVKVTRETMFVVDNRNRRKKPASDTYVVFGEAKIEDLSAQAQMAAAEKFKQQSEPVAQKPAVPKIEEDEEDEGEVDEEGVEAKDVELVMQQAGVSKGKAVKALKNNNNDIVNAIMELTM